jgi:2-keto-4-pentenoate hydratase
VGPGVTAADVRAATRAVAPAIEIIDSRIADWRISLVDTIADNASSCGVALGPWQPLGELELPDVRADLVVDGAVICGGTGADVMGDPAESVAWLANTCASFGIHLEAGQIVLTGSCTGAFDVRAGSRVEGHFTDLGAVTLNFV